MTKLSIFLFCGLVAAGVLPAGVAVAGSTTSDTGYTVDPCYQQCHPVQISSGNKAFKRCMNSCQAGVPASSGAQSNAYGPDTCASGYVWREAIPSDHVCVTPQSRALVASENQNYRSLIDVHGAYGSNSCINGYVWREAFSGDAVCVTPPRRAAVLQENAMGPSRVAR